MALTSLGDMVGKVEGKEAGGGGKASEGPPPVDPGKCCGVLLNRKIRGI